MPRLFWWKISSPASSSLLRRSERGDSTTSSFWDPSGLKKKDWVKLPAKISEESMKKGVSKNRCTYPQIVYFAGVFHDFHRIHFGVITLFVETPMIKTSCRRLWLDHPGSSSNPSHKSQKDASSTPIRLGGTKMPKKLTIAESCPGVSHGETGPTYQPWWPQKKCPLRKSTRFPRLLETCLPNNTSLSITWIDPNPESVEPEGRRQRQRTRNGLLNQHRF